MKEPLALPRGSVRALLALAVVGSAVYLFATGQQVTNEHLTLAGVAITFYFSTREGESPVEDDSPPEPFLGGEESA